MKLARVVYPTAKDFAVHLCTRHPKEIALGKVALARPHEGLSEHSARSGTLASYTRHPRLDAAR